MKVVLQDIKKVNTEALIVVFFEDIRPLKGMAGELDWLLCGALSRLIIQGKLSGRRGDAALITPNGKIPVQKIFMIGAGPQKNISPSAVAMAAKDAVTIALSAGVKQASLEIFPPPGMPYEIGLPALRKGVSEGAGGRETDIALLARDASAYENISKFFQH